MMCFTEKKYLKHHHKIRLIDKQKNRYKNLIIVCISVCNHLFYLINCLSPYQSVACFLLPIQLQQLPYQKA